MLTNNSKLISTLEHGDLAAVVAQRWLPELEWFYESYIVKISQSNYEARKQMSAHKIKNVSIPCELI